ncbi:hypothetical protein MNL13_06370 [Bartonella krasnovii]|uniref:Uncharacterized protein n=1 Tax=Bartonella krasnovii TaxID=2267275 RepID=A0ABY3VWZ8_9HYPH|nr:hypothetical protein [Bartonella krasnovii]UNF28826.1 hypothetical protein MNL13_06370 [Bartonella krasnovii]
MAVFGETSSGGRFWEVRCWGQREKMRGLAAFVLRVFEGQREVPSMADKLKVSSVFSLGEWGCCIFVLSIGVAFGEGGFGGGLLWGEVV